MGGCKWGLLCLASLDCMTWVENSTGSDDLVPRVDIRSAVAATSGEQRDSAECGPSLRTKSEAESQRTSLSGYDPESMLRDTKGFVYFCTSESL